MSDDVLVECKGVVKSFPGVWEHLILDRIDFDVRAREVHGLLGENGAGKTVLANIMSGFYTLTSGQIIVRGENVRFRSPADAIRHGICMVHQEFTLAPALTVLENLAITLRKTNPLRYPLKAVEKKARSLTERYGIKVDLHRPVEQLSMGERQRVEILKTLLMEPNVLILDEPTSVLTREEVEELFKLIHAMKEAGKGIVFITHRIEEIMAVADRVTVLRLGKKMGTFQVSETSREQLLKLMIGELPVISYERERKAAGRVVLKVEELVVEGDDGRIAVNGVSFTVCEGEIVGIAGISGNGQSELVEAITGTRRVKSGRVFFEGEDVTNRGVRKIVDLGIRHIPEDRRSTGVVEQMNTAENIVLRVYREKPFSSFGLINKKQVESLAREVVEKLNVLTPDLWSTEVRILSGGNIQRLILGRELWRMPRLVVAFHPTYGLDYKGLKQTHNLFMEMRAKGTALLLVSEDIEEVFLLSDRILVMSEGRVVGEMDREKATVEAVGLLMTGMGASGDHSRT
jgi:ABC-type uncharacterized transport system ATPase subunit